MLSPAVAFKCTVPCKTYNSFVKELLKCVFWYHRFSKGSFSKLQYVAGRNMNRALAAYDILYHAVIRLVNSYMIKTYGAYSSDILLA